MKQIPNNPINMIGGYLYRAFKSERL